MLTVLWFVADGFSNGTATTSIRCVDLFSNFRERIRHSCRESAAAAAGVPGFRQFPMTTARVLEENRAILLARHAQYG
jgi:hypothetical protein